MSSRRLPLAALFLLLFFQQCTTLGVRQQTRAGRSAPAPTSTPAPPPRGFTDADYAKHVAQLNAKLHGKAFTVVIQKPFVVVGDGPAASVRAHATETVKWAVDKLKQDFFTKDPAAILDIWLFKDTDSYRKHTREIFGDSPETPYGYYSSAHKALIMNIETGGGTLVHEIVHPFMEANFPACPPWLNEGLGSLYEQCGEVDGRIYGYTNWRLEGLQRFIKTSKLPAFKTLLAMDADAFYNKDKGTNYAQARYLCYYLQEKNLLVKFYREFNARHAQDPTGFQTLQAVLGEPDTDAFQKRWEKFVLNLGEEFRLEPLMDDGR